MPKPAVYVLDPYHTDAVRALQGCPAIQLTLPDDPEKHKYVDHATVLLVRSETQIKAADVAKCKKLQCIVKQGVGVDNIDLEACRAAGIRVFNTPGLNSEAVAELCLALALSLSRRVAEIDRQIRQGGRIVRSKTLGRSLYKKTLGIVGMGGIGLAFAKKWVGAMGGKVIGFDPYSDGSPWSTMASFRRVDTLQELLRTCDVVSLHVPLTKDTKNLISDAEFELMPPETILLNCARGGIVNEEALLRALKAGKLFGVGLDAMLVEPPTLDAYRDLLSASNVVVTPHVGASTMENQSQSGLAAVEIALEYVRGNERGNRVA